MCNKFMKLWMMDYQLSCMECQTVSIVPYVHYGEEMYGKRLAYNFPNIIIKAIDLLDCEIFNEMDKIAIELQSEDKLSTSVINKMMEISFISTVDEENEVSEWFRVEGLPCPQCGSELRILREPIMGTERLQEIPHGTQERWKHLSRVEKKEIMQKNIIKAKKWLKVFLDRNPPPTR